MNDALDQSNQPSFPVNRPAQGSPGSEGLAITSMILGIFSIVACLGPLAGIPAVICGHLARGKARRGEAGGDGMALAGLITGYIGIFLIGITILPAMLLPALSNARESARKIACLNNLKQIGLSLRIYSNAYKGQFPPYDGAQGLELLRKEGFLENPKIYVCPSSKTKAAAYGESLTEDTVDYVYIGNHSENDSTDAEIAYGKDGNHRGYRNVLYLDGHVKGWRLNKKSTFRKR
ncbi:MAG: DUF4190 domain-containing protein [Kiritimatiellaeota bacterium]|nr:DUF4190 domain-containing protein [Kiritimatiellota bacterium]